MPKHNYYQGVIIVRSIVHVGSCGSLILSSKDIIASEASYLVRSRPRCHFHLDIILCIDVCPFIATVHAQRYMPT